MHLPEEFTRRVVATFAPDGAPWLAALPGLIAACAARWDLAVGPPFPDLSYNYVAPATLPDGAPAVLKLGVPREELSTEIDALRHYAGRGAARLLAADEAAGALLLERLAPGGTLAPLAARDDEAATRVAAEVQARLWRPPPPGHRYPSVADWAAGLSELRPRFGGGTGPFPARLVERAEALFAWLLATQADPVVLHGDLHHFNILDAGGGEWRAIDPKGVVGEPAYEAGALLRNPIPDISRRPRLAELLARRIAVIAAIQGLDPGRLRAWALAQAVLSAWWSYEDGDPAPDLAVALA
ncbi:MAG TPA: aminoglycoside phosphotransferase family protein, partial [Chloroflexaceae bacterium]|nr:aminoglycoside phosphotransferase family protein [Chloroflexaceae bacterium]